MDKNNKSARIDTFRLGSLALAGYFFFVFHSEVGFPPTEELDFSSITYLILSVFFVLLPSAKTLRLGKWIEYEAKVGEIEEEVRHFKDETRQILAVQNNLLNTVSNTVSQNVNITLPPRSEIEEAKHELDRAIKEPTSTEVLEQEIEQFVLSGGSDLNFALAKLRMELEKELRRILEKRLKTPDPGAMRSRFYSAKSLFRKFVERYPEYQGMSSSFEYVLSVCNAAIHGQFISDGHSHEALQMGFTILDELEKVGVDGT